MTALRTAARPLPVAAIAEAIGLHANTTRWHLDQLVEVGWVERTVENEGRRGRPRWLYVPTQRSTSPLPGAEAEADDGYRILAEILAEYLSTSRADPASAAVEAGRAWGKRMVESGSPSAPVDAGEATRRVVALLDDLGFAPDVRGERAAVATGDSGDPGEPDDEQPIILHACPFREVAAAHPDVACSVHLGIMQGALAELGRPETAARLRPHNTPDTCLASIDE